MPLIVSLYKFFRIRSNFEIVERTREVMSGNSSSLTLISSKMIF